MVWSTDNRACKTTWTTLMVLEQLHTDFASAGRMKMSELRFWNSTASAASRRAVAEGLAIEIDQVFREIRKAEFEPNVTRLEVLEAMTALLLDAQKTIEALADATDAHYRFWREQS